MINLDKNANILKLPGTRNDLKTTTYLNITKTSATSASINND
jgi:hypothetical protein